MPTFILMPHVTEPEAEAAPLSAADLLRDIGSIGLVCQCACGGFSVVVETPYCARQIPGEWLRQAD